MKFISSFLLVCYGMALYKVGATRTGFEAIIVILFFAINLVWMVVYSIFFLDKAYQSNKNRLIKFLLIKFLLFLTIAPFYQLNGFGSDKDVAILYGLVLFIVTCIFFLIDQWISQNYKIDFSYPTQKGESSNWGNKLRGKILKVLSIVYFFAFFFLNPSKKVLAFGFLIIIIELICVYASIYKDKKFKQ